ncbi:hypothetical protein F2Q68_00027296 [Brassica cretica]|uniref:Uncharacterized protein n=1 Tax=Brassica cretica TaxID=69181 RepID=A0A8S9IE50_BRACR|nr:hypothetical protein F2Q68_00027296 [Brassica cretica]
MSMSLFIPAKCSGNASSAFLGTSEREARREGVDMLLLDEKQPPQTLMDDFSLFLRNMVVQRDPMKEE